MALRSDQNGGEAYTGLVRVRHARALRAPCYPRVKHMHTHLCQDNDGVRRVYGACANTTGSSLSCVEVYNFRMIVYACVRRRVVLQRIRPLEVLSVNYVSLILRARKASG